MNIENLSNQKLKLISQKIDYLKNRMIEKKANELEKRHETPIFYKIQYRAKRIVNYDSYFAIYNV